MNLLNDNLKLEIKKHSLGELPNECCGIIYENKNIKSLIKCENTAKDKINNFKICPTDYIKAESMGKIIAYYHSHPDDNVGKYSDADKKISDGHKLPLIMYCVKKDKFLQYN